MRGYSALVAFATAVSTATAVVYQGFNYGSDQMDQTSFETAFKAAQALSGAPGGGFTSARLYTMIQSGTPDTPISAIPAAIKTKTSLLLGLWISADMAPELSALTKAISQYGNDLAKLVVGISVGSEDLYRITQIARDNKETVAGASPDYVVQCINQVRNAVKGTVLAGAPIGHVDTWNSWDNSSNKMVIDNSDWLGTDAYPYWEATYENTIENSKNLFFDALSKTNAAAKGKPVWITETGFPVSGKASNKATPSVENARKYWRDVGCGLFGTYSTWWFQLSGLSDHGTLDFGLMKDPSASPYFDLSCPPDAST
ncbi:glycoside hydrolase superfamily [Lasiosphaeria ovina]|uniref:Probable glucan endo-1,3-beta-glucosidase eglC n=1 Tax=Lasiosphaeria ovina TaxID=92902 RepID=A0AAE0K3J6_9PEZI|nr:glycoside hydrolase superfamily [Lasiosphaeria ovina]